MKSIHCLPLALGLSMGAIALQAPLVQALSPAEVARIARGVTVRVESQAPGSGVIINQSGDTYTVLTAAHVVASDDFYEIVTTDNARHTIKNSTIQRFGGVDLAILTFSSGNTYRVATIGSSHQAEAGTPCYVSGYPEKSIALNEVIYNFTQGTITANASQPLRDGYGLVYTNATLPGMSGGAVLNGDGHLIGVHGRADTIAKAQNPDLNPDIYVKTGFNLGIPINTFLASAQEAKIPFKLPTPKGAATETPIANHLLTGSQALYKGNNGEAISKFTSVIKSQDRNAIAHHGRGLAHYQRGDYQKALVDFNLAIMRDPYNAVMHNSRGLTYYAMGRSQQSRAVFDFTEAIKLDPNYAEAYNNRGLANRYLGAPQLAADDFTQAIRLNPALAKAYKNRGVTRNLIQDRQGGIVDLTQAIAIDPNDSSAYRARGRLKFAEGDLQGAIADQNQALKVNSKDYKALTERGIVLYEQSQVSQAISDWREAIAVSSKAADGARVLLGAILYRQGQTTEGINLAKEAIPIDRVWFNDGYLTQMLGKQLLADVRRLLADPQIQQALKR